MAARQGLEPGPGLRETLLPARHSWPMELPVEAMEVEGAGTAVLPLLPSFPGALSPLERLVA